MKRSFGPRKAADLSESTQRHLNMYAVAASAAGVGILAWAQRAEAKIVYTRVNKPLGFGLTILDLSNDGMPDFGFCENAFGSSRSTTCTLTLHQRQTPLREHHPPSPFSRVLYMIPPAASNQRNQILGGTLGASALPAGAPVGPKSKFTLGRKEMAFCFEATSTTCGGLWLNAQHRYLGLKFVISGQIHYGWARLNVASCCSATLTGYAYETIPNKRILTGDIVGPLRRAAEKRQGPDPDVDTTIEAQTASRTVPAYQPATLGMLALGSPALSIWWRAASPTF